MKLALFVIGVGIFIYLVSLLPPIPRVVEVKLTLQNGETISESYCNRMYKSDCYQCTSATYCSPLRVIEVYK